MAEHVGADRLHVLRRDVAATLEEGVRLGGEGQVERRARRGAILDEGAQVELVGLRLARGEDDVDDVVLDLVVDVDLVDQGARAEDLVGGHHGADALVVPRHRHPVEDLALLLARGIADAELQHEAVDLGLGEGVGPLLLDRVLRGEDEERVGQRVRLVTDRDLMLLHRLEERALHLRGGTVDLVGEDDLCEDRPLAGGEATVAGAVDHRADQVGGQEVGRELDAPEVRRDGLRQRLHGERLGEARHPLEEDVASGQETDQQAVDQVALADDHRADLLP